MSQKPTILAPGVAGRVYDNYAEGRSVATFLDAMHRYHPVVKVVSGYFYLSGLGTIERAIHEWMESGSPDRKMRLLIGRETDADTRDAILACIAEEFEQAAAIPGGELLAELISNGLLEIAVYDRARLHGKVYLFLQKPITPELPPHDVNGQVLWGSSNFSAAGVSQSGNLEFNALAREASTLRDIDEWFDLRWKEAKHGADITEDILKAVQKSLKKHRRAAPDGPTPFHVYLRMLQELHEQAERRKPGAEVVSGLANFQVSAARQAIEILDREDDPKRSTGFFVCDATGLGKTHVAIAVVKHFAARDWRVLLLAPSATLKTTWQRALANEGIMTKVGVQSLESFGNAERPPEIMKHAREYDLVVIDESHNLRNRAGERYRQVQALCRETSDREGGRRKRLLLLTATPINNRIDDLVSQIYLFAGYNQDLESVLARALQTTGKSYKDVRELLNDPDRRDDFIPELLGKIMVRRERWAIREYYEKFDPEGARLADGRPLAFLESLPPRPLSYTLKGLDPDVYKKLESALAALHLPDINVDDYLPEEAVTNTLLRRSVGNTTLILQGLLKRLESSVHAFAISIARQVAFYEAFLDDLEAEKHLERGRLLSRRLWQEGEDEEDELLWESEGNDDAPFDVTLYDRKRAMSDTQSDLEELRRLKELFDRLDDPKVDSKLASLRQQLDGAFADRKVLIFTQFADTASYLFDQLKSRGKVGLVTGQTARHSSHPGSKSTLQTIVKQFAPKANPDDQDELADTSNPVDVLVSTDVLAEGQNFQDCNVVVSYDITWNPVRIIQRVGRINRADSGYFHPEDKRAHTLVFFPEEDLTGILSGCLTLLRRNREKLQKIAGLVGHSEAVLFEDEETTRILYDRLVAGGDPEIYKELEREAARTHGLAAAFDDEDLLAAKYARLAATNSNEAKKAKGFDLPLVSCRSTRAGAAGVLALYRQRSGEETTLRWLWVPKGSAADAVMENRTEVVVRARCTPTAVRRPFSKKGITDTAEKSFREWLQKDVSVKEEARMSAKAGAAIAGKSAFGRLLDSLTEAVLSLSQSGKVDGATKKALAKANEWASAIDQLVYSKRDAAAADVEKLLDTKPAAGTLLARAAELAEKYPVAAGGASGPGDVSWEAVCLEEIRAE